MMNIPGKNLKNLKTIVVKKNNSLLLKRTMYCC